jgi:hypothetical protein
VSVSRTKSLDGTSARAFELGTVPAHLAKRASARGSPFERLGREAVKPGRSDAVRLAACASDLASDLVIAGRAAAAVATAQTTAVASAAARRGVRISRLYAGAMSFACSRVKDLDTSSRSPGAA